MKEYKILIIKNKLTKKVDFKKGLQWFEENTPIKIITEEIETDFEITFEQISNKTFAGVNVDDNIKPKLRTIIPRGKYHAVVFLYGNKATGIRVSVSDAVPLYPETQFIEVVKLTDGGLTLNHELFHSFFKRVASFGIYIEDPMDYVVINGKGYEYYNDKTLKTNKESNRTIAIARLNPYWDKVVNMDGKWFGFTQQTVSTIPEKEKIPTTQKPITENPANFEKAVNIILKKEGGYVNDPNDPGGETKYGISKSAYPSLNIKNITENEAKEIYKRDYWNVMKCQQMAYPIALNLFDAGVNMGTKTAVKMLQEVIGTTADGVVGPITLGALAKLDTESVVEKFNVSRIMRYVSLNTFKIYGKGWLNRTIDTLVESLKQ